MAERKREDFIIDNAKKLLKKARNMQVNFKQIALNAIYFNKSASEIDTLLKLNPSFTLKIFNKEFNNQIETSLLQIAEPLHENPDFKTSIVAIIYSELSETLKNITNNVLFINGNRLPYDIIDVWEYKDTIIVKSKTPKGDTFNFAIKDGEIVFIDYCNFYYPSRDIYNQEFLEHYLDKFQDGKILIAQMYEEDYLPKELFTQMSQKSHTCYPYIVKDSDFIDKSLLVARYMSNDKNPNKNRVFIKIANSQTLQGNQFEFYPQADLQYDTDYEAILVIKDYENSGVKQTYYAYDRGEFKQIENPFA